MDDYAISVATNIGLLSFVALSAWLVLLTGEVSFGQQGFFGVGAYGAGVGTAMLGWPLPAAALMATAAGAVCAVFVAAVTLRLRGMVFAIATLAFAEALRIGFELLHWQVGVLGAPVGPDGTQGFGGIRWAYENGWGSMAYLVLVWAVLTLVIAAFLWLERTQLGARLRAVGLDQDLAAAMGIDVDRIKLGALAVSGALAGLGGALFAHHNTYIEPANFNVMLGIHGLAYPLIGGLGTVLGPLLGVLFDVVVLEGSRAFSGLRMTVFGGAVALMLWWRPRGILDEHTVHRLRRCW